MILRRTGCASDFKHSAASTNAATLPIGFTEALFFLATPRPLQYINISTPYDMSIHLFSGESFNARFSGISFHASGTEVSSRHSIPSPATCNGDQDFEPITRMGRSKTPSSNLTFRQEFGHNLALNGEIAGTKTSTFLDGPGKGSRRDLITVWVHSRS